MAALNDLILSYLVQPRYMDLELATQMEQLSPRFLVLSRNFKRKLTQLDIKQVLHNCTIPELFLNIMCDQLSNINLVTNVEPEKLEAVTKFTKLSSMHLTELDLSASSFALLRGMSNLHSLSIDQLYYEEDFRVDSEPQKLNLSHLTVYISVDLGFLDSMCRLEHLTSLYVSLGNTTGSERELLRRCVNLKQLTVIILLGVTPLDLLFSAVDALPRLADFRLEGMWFDKFDLELDERVRHNLTTLQVGEESSDNAWQLLASTKFPRLRALKLPLYHVALAAHIFEAQPALVVLPSYSQPTSTSNDVDITCDTFSQITRSGYA